MSWIIVSWTARRQNQSILKEINLQYSVEGLMLMLKLQYSGHLMRRATSLEKTLLLGKIEGRRKSGWQRMRWLDGITNSWYKSLSILWKIVKVREGQHVISPWDCKDLDMKEQLNWKTTTRKQNWNIFTFSLYPIPPEIGNSKFPVAFSDKLEKLSQ